MSRQRLTSTLYRCFVTNLQIRSLQLEQPQNYHFLSAKNRKVVASVVEKSICSQFFFETCQI